MEKLTSFTLNNHFTKTMPKRNTQGSQAVNHSPLRAVELDGVATTSKAKVLAWHYQLWVAVSCNLGEKSRVTIAIQLPDVTDPQPVTQAVMLWATLATLLRFRVLALGLFPLSGISYLSFLEHRHSLENQACHHAHFKSMNHTLGENLRVSLSYLAFPAYQISSDIPNPQWLLNLLKAVLVTDKTLLAWGRWLS